ncbi:MAG: glycosyltransferase family 2 protein [candidate division WOR-3 bacterium]
MKPKVSVIIPTYNRPKELEKAVKSVLENGYENVEVLIGYDGEAYGEFKDNRVKTFVFEHTGNPSYVRNRLAELSTGDFITFLDDDDIYLYGKIERQVDVLRKGDYDATFCNVLVFDNEKGEFFGLAYKNKTIKLENFLYIHAKFGLLVFVGAWMLKRDFFNRIGGFNEDLKFVEDWEFGVRVFLNGKVLFDNFTGVIHYMYRPDSLNVREGRPENFLKAALEVSKLLKGFEKRKFLGYAYGVASYKSSRVGKKEESLKYSIIGLSYFPNIFSLRGMIRAILR